MPDSVRILITGSRKWNCPKLADRVVRTLADRHGSALVIVHGAATGVDQTFADACKRLGVTEESHPADWDRLGKAGPIRNQEMVALGARYCLSFHQRFPVSGGTADCVRRAIKAGISTWWTGSEDGKPHQINDHPLLQPGA